MANNKIKGLTVEIGGDTTKLGQALESVNKKSGDLSSELGEINRLLKFNPDSTDLLAQKQKVLADIIENTSDKLKTLKEAEKQVQKQFERGEVSEEQVRALQREIIATESKLEHYEKQAKEATEGTKDLGDAAANSGEGFTVMKGAMANLVSDGIGALVQGISNLLSSFWGLPEATREYRTEIGKLNTAFETVGHSTEVAGDAYKTLYSVIGETDQSVEAAQQIALLAESEKDVAQWADLAAGVVARFGDALQPETFFEAANETIKLGEATGAYTQMLEGVGYNVEEFNAGLAACTTEAEKQAYMLEITESLLGSAADAYRETNAEVIRENEAIEAWNATLADAGASLAPLQTDVKLLGASILTELMPGITGLTDAFRGLVNGEEGSTQAVGEALSGLLTQVLNKAVELLPTLTETVMSLLTTLTTTIISMLPQLVDTGVQIIMAILNGLTIAIPQITQALVDMIPLLVNALVTGIPQIINGAVQLLIAIVDAIPLILPPLIDAIPAIVLTIVDGLLVAIPELLAGAVQLLMAVVQAVPYLIDALLPQVPTIVDAVIDGLLDCLPVLIDGAIQLFFGILEAIPEISAACWKSAPSIVKSIVNGLMSARKGLVDAGWDLISRLIEGMFDFDYMGSLRKLSNGIVDGFKKLFDIHSPSRVMAGLGELLDEGLAVGITANANAPVNALDKLSGDMLDSTDVLNGASLERRVTHSYASAHTTTPVDGISSKLDQIYKAILSGQVIMLDGKTLVGSTADRYDNELGQRRVLAERGAL